MAVFGTGFTKVFDADKTDTNNPVQSMRTTRRRKDCKDTDKDKYRICVIIEGGRPCCRWPGLEWLQLELSPLQPGARSGNAAEPAVLALPDRASRQISHWICRTHGASP